MMIGVAHVIGMKPILRLFFSGAPACANASLAVAMGNSAEMAADTVPDAHSLQESAPLHRIWRDGAQDSLFDKPAVHLFIVGGSVRDRRAGAVVLALRGVIAAHAACARALA